MYIIVHALRYVQYADAAASWTTWMWTMWTQIGFAINFMEKQSFEKTESETLTPPDYLVVLG